MESIKSKDFKSNVADLTKIPPNEFEKYFKEWMERDDVARSLQAKLRCDLIKNFNKTNLGKHILSHTMTSSGGSTLRLTLSPLVLAINTLVAEFLYAQNCHFTLSVFCTEIPFRNTLPDFENMRRFRFNSDEICEIWQAVTGSKVNKKDLNKNVIQNYETNPNLSLLLLIIKCLLKKDPLEQLKRNAEAQTEVQEKAHKSISAQVSDRDRKSSRDDNLDHINKYLLTLSEKVVEMTKEFEQFAKQRESRSRSLRSSRSREYYALNKSLERITENIKSMAQAKRKNKRLSNIVQSIDHLTQQFGKCAQNFDNVTKVLGSKEDKTEIEKPKCVKVKLKDKQTETELEEKSYADWIYEMRNTENGRKFLNRVDISLRKALSKHREQLQTETDIKIKHLKSLIKLYYQQKCSKYLLRDPKINLEETRKCNDNIEKKLKQFEKKQIELFQKLKESSLELQESQLQQKERSRGGENIPEKKDKICFEDAASQVDLDNVSKHEQDMVHKEESQGSNRDKDSNITFKGSQFSYIDVSNAQEQILDMAQNIAEQGRSVDRIIFDAKLRIQQLENESNQLEQNFQSYLERRKSTQELDNSRQKMPKLCHSLKDLYEVTSARLRQERRKIAAFQKEEEDEETDEEFIRLKETLQQKHEPQQAKPKSAKSNCSTSSLEIRNAILEAKLKFFEHEKTIRKCREQGEEIRTGNLLQKQLERCSVIQELPDYFSHNFEHFASETDINFETQTEDKTQLDLDLENLSEINAKDKTVDEIQNVDLRPMMEDKTQKVEDEKPSTSVKRALFLKDVKQNENDTSFVKDLHSCLRYHEPISMPCKDLQQHLKGEKINENSTNKLETTAKLIKQSMAKVQQLFEQQSKSEESLKEIVTEMQQEKCSESEDLQNLDTLNHRPHEALDKSLTTTMTSSLIDTTNTTKASQEIELKISPKILESISSLNRISNTSVPSFLNIFTESEDSTDSSHYEIKTSTDTIKKIDERQTAANEPTERVFKIIKEHQDMDEVNEPFQESDSNLQQAFGQLNNSPNSFNLNVYSPGNVQEIGEVIVESNQTLAPIDKTVGGPFSSRSSSDFEISTGQQIKDGKNLGDDSESDFWA